MRVIGLSGAVLLLTVAGGQVQAQGSTTWIPRGTALGITVDRFHFDSEFRYHAVTFHVSSLNPNHLTPEFGISIFPAFLGSEVVITNVDVGGAINISLPHATLLLRGGVSGIFALGSGAMALPGAHYGASLLFKVAGKNGIRLDVLRRVYYLPYELSPATVTVGLGITALPAIH